MKRLLTSVLLASAAVSGFAATPAPVRFDWFQYTGRDDLFAAPLPAGSYRNPILTGFYPDPAICRVGQDYYLINSTFSYFPGIPIFHSRDLVNWTQIGNVIDRPSQMDFNGKRITRSLFAPTIKYHDGVFYVVCTHVDGGGNFLVTATDPAVRGPTRSGCRSTASIRRCLSTTMAAPGWSTTAIRRKISRSIRGIARSGSRSSMWRRNSSSVRARSSSTVAST
jgi:hypothetical protein